jgi:hypothetical protein
MTKSKPSTPTVDRTSEASTSSKIEEEKEYLKKTILEEIGVETLKKEVLDELKKSRSKFNEFGKHPAILLLLGFIFTTTGGTIISSCYQRKEWSRQQTYLVQQRRLEEMNKIAKDSTQITSEMLSAADDALALFFWNTSDSKPSDDDRERKERWEQASLKWRTAIFTLPPQLNIYFADEQINRKLKEIDDAEVIIGNDLKNLLTDYMEDKSKALEDTQNKEDAASCLDEINKARRLLGELTGILNKKIQDEAERKADN